MMNRLALLRPVRGTLVFAVVLQAAASVLVLAPLVVLAGFTGAWLQGDPLPESGVVLAAAAASVGSALLAAAANLLTHRADADLTWHLRRRLAAVVRRLPMPLVSGHGAARIKKVVHDDTNATHYLVAHTVLDATALTTTPLAGLAVLAVIDWRLAVCGLVPLAAGVWCYLRALRGSGANFAEYATQQRYINAAVVDYVRGLPVAKIYGGPGGARTRYEETSTGFHDFFRGWSARTATVTTASWLVVTPAVTAGGFALLGALGVHADLLTPTAFVAGVLLGPAVSAPVAVAGPRLQAIRTGMSALGAIGEFLHQTPLDWGTSTAPAPGGLRLDHVTYRYPDGTTALDDISVTLPETGLIGIVGASGSGKSTLAALLARFADPATGRVLLGGTDLRELTESSLYEHVGFVFQNTALRRASVRDNLTGGRPAGEEDVIAAAVAAAVHDDILALPHGYDTILGDDTDLSGGQRQRLCLARALLRRPRVLVLDEATSAVDPTTRAALMNTLADEARRRAVVLITHHLPSVTAADRILVLEHGRLAGDGTHPELLDRCAAYRSLQDTGQELVTDRKEG